MMINILISCFAPGVCLILATSLADLREVTE